MNTSNLTFTANDQELVKNSGLEEYASNSVSYIKATFTLGENWSGFDSVRAVWSSYYNIISTVLDTNNSCLVPAEMLLHKSEVKVNLVGSIVENNVLTDRLTTFPIKALKVSADAQVNGTETAPVSPSQFEQFVDSVEAAAQSVTDYSYDSEAWAKGTRGGTAVSSSDPTYHNNSKYWNDQGAALSQEVTNLKSDIDTNKYSICKTETDLDNYFDFANLINFMDDSLLSELSKFSITNKSRFTIKTALKNLSEPEVWIPIDIVPEKTYRISFDFTASSGCNLRLYKSDKSTLAVGWNLDSGEVIRTSFLDTRIYIRLGLGSTLGNYVDITSAEFIPPTESTTLKPAMLKGVMKNASLYGVLPTNSGTENYTNFQALLDGGGTIVVDKQGTYDINGQLEIGSNTTLIFGKDVYMRKTNNVGGFIINKGAITTQFNTNIEIDGLHLICNSTQGSTMTSVYGLRGELGFMWVENLVIRDFTCLDLPVDGAYCIHISNYVFVTIDHAWIEGGKDGIHSSRGKWLTIRNCRFSTADDPIALNALDYYTGCPQVGNIDNVLIENCVNYYDGETSQRQILILGGSWSAWRSGNQYRSGDTIINSEGNIYRFAGSSWSKDLYTSTVEPTGRADFQDPSGQFSWLYTQHESIYSAIVRNVTIRNYTFFKGGTNLVLFLDEDTIYLRSVYPGSEVVPHQNITIDACAVEPSVSVENVAEVQMPVDMLRIINSQFVVNKIVDSSKNWDTSGSNNRVCCDLQNNKIGLPYGESDGVVIDADDGYVFKVTALGNLKVGEFPMHNSGNGTVSMALDDLTI